jgi:hypothetical protein
MKIKIIICISLFLFYSCKSNKKTTFYPTGEVYSIIELNKAKKNHGSLKIFYETGEISGIGFYKNGYKDGSFKEFYKSGNLKSVEIYRKGKIVDTTRFFNANQKLIRLKYKKDSIFYQKEFNEFGELLVEGQILDTLKTNWWKFYKNSKLFKEVEFLVKGSKEHLNQIIFYDEYGNTIYDKSNYYNSNNIPDTISINKTLVGSIKLFPYLSKDKDFHMVYFKYLDSSGNIIFSDSSYGKNNKEAYLWGKFKKIGVKILKGYILEEKLVQEVNKKDTSMVDMFNLEHKMYFRKEIYVIEDKKINNLNKKLTDNKRG